MEVVIEDVQPGTCDPNDPNDIPFDHWIIAILKDGQKIHVLDEVYDLTKFKGQKAELVIHAKEAVEYPEKKVYTIYGEYIKNYKFPKSEIEKYRFDISNTLTKEKYFKNLSNGIPALKTKNGIFLVSKNPLYNDGDMIEYNVIGFILRLWYPIEE